jgi:hypothetical protein
MHPAEHSFFRGHVKPDTQQQPVERSYREAKLRGLYS